MVLIFSKNDDYSTSCVIRWLISNKINFLRLNENDEIVLKSLTQKNFVFLYRNIEYSFESFSSVWYRRGGINILMFDKNNSYLKIENNAIIDSLYRLLDEKKHINNFFNADFNKLQLLNYQGFETIKFPESLITQLKSNAILFFDKYRDNVISKPLAIPFSLINESSIYMSYTCKTTLDEINNLPDIFVPTLFQMQIKKKYEIRTFVFDNKTYSMCIFSQNNNQTQIDFRNYDEKKPNRVTPFLLPKNIENQLFKMLSVFSIDCASLDLIYTLDDEYYLIDVNPIGQFGMVSVPCNYHLEKKIAEYLLK